MSSRRSARSPQAGSYVHPASARAWSPPTPRSAERADADPLSEREHEVLRLLALGHTNQEIAEPALHLGPHRRDAPRSHHAEAALATRAELVRYALGQGLLEEKQRRRR